jgi:small-conductance mechanosensitive channel
MAETKSTAPRTSAEQAPAGRGLVPASESSNPEVHQLLSQREAHVMNAGLDEDPELAAARKAAKDAVARIDDQLAKLGVTAQ